MIRHRHERPGPYLPVPAGPLGVVVTPRRDTDATEAAADAWAMDYLLDAIGWRAKVAGNGPSQKFLA